MRESRINVVYDDGLRGIWQANYVWFCGKLIYEITDGVDAVSGRGLAQGDKFVTLAYLVRPEVCDLWNYDSIGPVVLINRRGPQSIIAD